MPCPPLTIRNLTCDVLAAAFTPAPMLTQAAILDPLNDDYLLTGLVLTSTLLNYGTAPMGVFLVLGQSKPTIAFSNSTISPVMHVTLQNSLTGPPAVPVPTTKTTPVTFARPFPIPAGTPIALYVFGDTTALNRANAYLSLQLVAGR